MLLSLLALKLVILSRATPPSIAGVVRDGESGRPLVEAMVSLPDLDRSVTTDSLGRYLLLDVPAGPQHLTVRRIGYAPRTLHAFVPDEGRLTIDVALHPVPLQLAPLVVKSVHPIRGLEPEDSTRFPDRGASLQAIHNDPTLSEPDDFLALSGGEVASAPESPSGMHVRGAPSDQTGYVLDGIPVLSPYHAAGVFSAWNPDAVERVQLSSTSPSPVYPAALSGTISGVTRPPAGVLSSQGSMSTSQARIALDGPLGAGGAGFLVSFRRSYPAWYAPHDPSYLGGQTQDALAKLEAPLLGW
jgi:carboxypeptidase family protein/TonB-dependent receptor-like protein